MIKRTVLLEAIKSPNSFKGWLYLKPGAISADTQCIFYEADKTVDPAEDASIRESLAREGWQSTVSASDIEDVTLNCLDQIEEPSISDLILALTYYIEEDAFIDFGG